MKRTRGLIALGMTVMLVFAAIVPASEKSNVFSGHRNRRGIKKCEKNPDLVQRVYCYTALIEQNPSDAVLYALRGATHLRLFKYNCAIEDFIKVVELEPGNIDAYYAVATAASLAYNKEHALRWLQKAFDAGFCNIQTITTDASLDNIRNSPEFRELIKRWRYDLSAIR